MPRYLETNTILNNTWVKKEVKTETRKYSELTEKVKYSMSSFVGLLALTILWMLFIKLKKSSSSPILLRVWGYFKIMSGCWIMSNAFSALFGYVRIISLHRPVGMVGYIK